MLKDKYLKTIKSYIIIEATYTIHTFDFFLHECAES